MKMISPKQACQQLRHTAPGYARLLEVLISDSESVVTLDYVDGGQVTLRVPGAPGPDDHQVPAPLVKVYSVQIRNTSQTSCVAVGASPAGPRRVTVSLMQALALAHDGTYAVMMTACHDRPV